MIIPEWIECVGIVTGLLSVWLATRTHEGTWYVGIISQLAYFVVFYRAQLYSDMFLQVFYTVLCVYGIFLWRQPAANLSVSVLSGRKRLLHSFFALVAIGVWGSLMLFLPFFVPFFFPIAAAFPYLDGAVGVLSVFATFYQAEKRLEAWLLWILIDLVAAPLYAFRGLPLTALLYVIFLGLAFRGFSTWRKEMVSR